MSITPQQPELEFTKFSSEYSDVRTRELEGTYPNNPELGVWAINSWRVAMGWGMAPSDVYPLEEDWPFSPASDFDEQAKAFRAMAVFRAFDAHDAMEFIDAGFPVNSNFYVTDRWQNTSDGKLDFQQSKAEIVGGHSLSLEVPNPFSPIPLNWSGDDFFVFRNTWGREWGHRGWGAMTKQFFNENMYEAWCSLPVIYKEQAGQGIASHSSDMRVTRDRHVFLNEIFDHDANNRLAWITAVLRHGVLNIEDLYVKPDMRNNGYGASLIESVKTLVRQIGCDVKFWIPFADIDCNEKRDGLLDFFNKFELRIEVSPHQWAAYVATPGKPVTHLPEIWLPPKPAYCFSQSRQEEVHWDSLKEEFGVSDQLLDATKSVFRTQSGVLKRLS